MKENIEVAVNVDQHTDNMELMEILTVIQVYESQLLLGSCDSPNKALHSILTHNKNNFLE